jgi:hypothetical protein
MPARIATFDLVLCTSVLEHVADVQAAAATLRRLTTAGGYLLITVPRTYPPHRSPIDNGYRPSNREIETLFRGLAVLHSETICPPRDKWFHWLIFPPGVSIPRVSCVLLRNASGPAKAGHYRNRGQPEGGYLESSRVAENGRPLGRARLTPDTRTWRSTRVGCSRTGPVCFRSRGPLSGSG